MSQESDQMFHASFCPEHFCWPSLGEFDASRFRNANHREYCSVTGCVERAEVTEKKWPGEMNVYIWRDTTDEPRAK